MTRQLGAVEAGGTKFVCAVGTGPENIVARTKVATQDPATTIGNVLSFFAEHDVTAIGVASFGPLELRRRHELYGYITTTPKPGWSNTEIVGPLEAATRVPIGFDTDVNGAALGEGRWGAARGLSTFVYVTIGTGIGGGAVVNGQVAHGLVHAEMGHLSVRRKPGDDFAGTCPFHGDCFEGMASGPSMAARWGTPAETLTGDALEAAIEIEAHYIAEGLRNIVYAIAPERIIVGGGVSSIDGLLPQVRRKLTESLAGYPGLPDHEKPDFVTPPGLGDGSGIAGAFALAETALAERL
ncbi:MAG: ROK family protein [Acidimicrobiia bacterium]|nr:ROK family protein [Acidimicrobiia bacterium]